MSSDNLYRRGTVEVDFSFNVRVAEVFDDLLDRVEETAHKLHERNTQLEILEKQL